MRKTMTFKEVLKAATDKGYVTLIQQEVWDNLKGNAGRGDLRKYERLEAAALLVWLIVKHHLPLDKETAYIQTKFVDSDMITALYRAIQKVPNDPKNAG